MKRVIAALLTVTMLAASAPAWADPPPKLPTVPSVALTPPPIITPLVRGQVAPWPGVLLSPPAVAQVVAQRDTNTAAIALAVQHQAEIDAAQQKYSTDSAATTCTADKSVLNAQLTDAMKQNQLLTQELKSATSGPSDARVGGHRGGRRHPGDCPYGICDFESDPLT